MQILFIFKNGILMTKSVAKRRLNTLKELLAKSHASTQEDLVEELSKRNFEVTQSTISRDLRKLGAIKTLDQNSQTVYRLPEEVANNALFSSLSRGIMQSIQHNGALIVIHTAPGSASLVARQLDEKKPNGILGTLAGDDTVFVAPASIKKIDETVESIIAEFS